jgi:prolyl-tRNA synthetase
MTLEINEISIQITVGPQPHEPAHAPLTIPAAAAALQNGQIEQIVERCVQSVLQQLRRRERR